MVHTPVATHLLVGMAYHHLYSVAASDHFVLDCYHPAHIPVAMRPMVDRHYPLAHLVAIAMADHLAHILVATHQMADRHYLLAHLVAVALVGHLAHILVAMLLTVDMYYLLAHLVAVALADHPAHILVATHLMVDMDCRMGRPVGWVQVVDYSEPMMDCVWLLSRRSDLYSRSGQSTRQMHRKEWHIHPNCSKWRNRYPN